MYGVSSKHAVEQPATHEPPGAIPSAGTPGRRAGAPGRRAGAPGRRAGAPVVRAERHSGHHRHLRQWLAVLATAAAAATATAPTRRRRAANREPRGAERRNTSPRRRRQRKLEFPNYPADGDGRTGTRHLAGVEEPTFGTLPYDQPPHPPPEGRENRLFPAGERSVRVRRRSGWAGWFRRPWWPPRAGRPPSSCRSGPCCLHPRGSL